MTLRQRILGILLGVGLLPLVVFLSVHSAVFFDASTARGREQLDDLAVGAAARLDEFLVGASRDLKAGAPSATSGRSPLSLHFLVRVDDRAGHAVGVLVAELVTAFVLEVLRDAERRVPGATPAALLNQRGEVLMGTGDLRLLARHPLLAGVGRGSSTGAPLPRAFTARAADGEEVAVSVASLAGLGTARGARWQVLLAEPLATMTADAVRTFRETLAAAALAVVVIVLLGLIVANTLMRRISVVTAGAQRVAAGDFTARVALEGAPEIVALQRSFNSMTAEIERLVREKDAAAEYLDELVTVRTAELAKRTREVELASRVKADFLQAASHELRTPLHQVIGFAELLQATAGSSSPERRQQYAESIVEGGRRLSRLVDDLLALASLEHDRMQLSPAPVALAELLHATAALFEAASSKGVQLSVELAPGADRVLNVDGPKLGHALAQLLSIAVRFTGAGGRVSLRATPSAEGVEIVVSDTGLGIAAERVATLFEAFTKPEVGRGASEGLGMGLAVANRLIALHGAKLWVKSRLGEGSEFGFTLGLANPVASTEISR